MLSLKNKKYELLESIVENNSDKDFLFLDFCKIFYQNVSFGYMDFISKNKGKILSHIAKQAFDFLQKEPTEESLKVLLLDNKKYGIKTLFLHSFDSNFLVRSITIWLKKNGIFQDEIIHPSFSVLRNQKNKINSINFEGDAKECMVCIILPIDASIPENYEFSLQSLYKKLVVVEKDFELMKQDLFKIAASFESSSDSNINQTGKFLRWLNSGNFVNLGMIKKSLKNINVYEKYGLLKIDEEIQLESKHHADIKENELEAKYVFHLSKKYQRSDIYRESRIDLIEIFELNADNKVEGITQVIGIFESDFYKYSPFEVPYLCEKAEKVYKYFGFLNDSYDGKLLLNIIESIPLDEFYYLNVDQLVELSSRVLNMYDGLTVFIRQDDFGRSSSILVYLPKHRYSEELKVRLGKVILRELGGVITSSNGFVGTASFARLVYVINIENSIDISSKEELLESVLRIESQTWDERFESLCAKNDLPSTIKFSKAYSQEKTPDEALGDAKIIYSWLKSEKNICFYITSKNNKLIIVGFKIGDTISLSQIMPIFSNFQIDVKNERSFFAEVSGEKIWIHYYETSDLKDNVISKNTKEHLIEGLYAAWNQITEVDPFNSLIINCELNFKEIIILRALGRFLKQIGFSYSQKALADCLSAYPKITKFIVKKFYKKFDIFSKSKECKEFDCLGDVQVLLSEVTRLDHDRILRRYINLVDSILRTNAFQNKNFTPYPLVSFKFNSSKITEIPKPAPFAEIFLYSPTMEACHLRGGEIARGGIRWSDRPEDFRFEVLGLMKAQMVKNAIIVPYGAKGGFVIKNYTHLKESGVSSENLKKVVVAEYSNFIKGILEITDNVVNNKIVAPNIKRIDGDDSYLVVAADKGTATFSDTANEISKKFNFWLDDAFASGGSKGYDHKKLGITAKGAWISVRRHFWEMGVDCQNTPISVVGVGDMSGDVFGNGMLQSESILLVAAFNHSHIFLDPNPDPNLSYQERKRLFNKSYSTWQDYNIDFISRGGGVYDRSLKSIEITEQVSKLFNIEQKYISPDELISKILTSEVDLLWFGGIGTFIKSSSESNTQVSDRSNDNVRVNANFVKAKVIAEGANLGVTQLGRIEFALNKGRINTDAVDNSAGVSCSDHEVNLKIMCKKLIDEEIISNKDRDELLSSLDKEVCELVLEDNWSQTFLLSKLEKESKNDIDSFILLIKSLEEHSVLPLKRDLEFIPSNEELAIRKIHYQGLTRPELAVIVAYSKIHLFQNIMYAFKNTACFGEKYYKNYFPAKFQKMYGNILYKHPLKIEITATVLSNLVINLMGPCFVNQFVEAFQTDSIEIVRAFTEIIENAEFDIESIYKQPFRHNLVDSINYAKKLRDDIAQCVMVYLKFPYFHFDKSYFLKDFDSKIPYAIRFAHMTSKRLVSQIEFENNYEKLSMNILWEWFSNKYPASVWEYSTLLVSQSNLIMLIVDLCNSNWTEERIIEYFKLFEKCQSYMSSVSDSKQEILLLDYVIKILSKKVI